MPIASFRTTLRGLLATSQAFAVAAQPSRCKPSRGKNVATKKGPINHAIIATERLAARRAFGEVTENHIDRADMKNAVVDRPALGPGG